MVSQNDNLMENFSSFKMYKQFLFFPIALILLSGCNLINPIRQLDCKTVTASGKNPPPIGFPTDYILNKRTGEYYGYDAFFYDKLSLLNGVTELDGNKYEIKTYLSQNKWIMEKVSTIKPTKITPYNFDVKDRVIVDLETMKYESISFVRNDIGGWEKDSVTEGICKWVKPKTTEILKKE
jgi:hypothetical protein